jgi:hypothetical protein
MRANSVSPFFIVGLALVFSFLTVSANAQTSPDRTVPSREAQVQQSSAPSRMPSEDEIRELLGKASEYVDTYKRTFTYTKPSLDKAATPGFHAKGMELSAQASSAIDAIRKNGSSAWALVVLVTILDDMSLNAAKASAATTLVALEENRNDPNAHAMSDFQDLAQVGKIAITYPSFW